MGIVATNRTAAPANIGGVSMTTGNKERETGSRIRRTRLVRVRVSEDELQRWRTAAAHHGVTNLSRWLRSLADQTAACGDNPMAWRRDLSRMLRDLNSGVGNNLHQIARGLTAVDPALPSPQSLDRLAGDFAAMRSEIRAHLLGRSIPRRRVGAVARPAGGAS